MKKNKLNKAKLPKSHNTLRQSNKDLILFILSVLVAITAIISNIHNVLK
ncbi:hypothetical protein B0H39_005999 [Clostridium beijerinckii]|nr:hypothetical protein [Clostridium beijerinckii]NOW87968.1 hypothetical protein [Clostridium beijerinckii]